MWSPVGRLVCAIVLLAAPAPPRARAQGPHEVVRGRVTADSATPLPGAAVLITRLPDRLAQATTTDADGRFLVDWPSGTGLYDLAITLPGRQPFRAQVRRTGPDTVLVVDARLAPLAAVQLPPVVVRAPAPVPSRDVLGAPETGAAETITFAPGAVRRLAPDIAGDLAAMVALVNPAALPVSGGYSVLGLAPGQNTTLLNGLAFPGTAIPRGAAAAVRSSASSYDPANGWFSGARTNVQLPVAGLFSSWDAHVTLDAPQVQASDPVASKLGQRFTSLDAVVSGAGRLLDDRFAYNASLQAGRRSADIASLQSADLELLQHSGVALDSANRFRQLVQQAGVPLAPAGVPGSATTDNVIFLGRLDHTPYTWNTMTPARNTWSLTGYGNRNRVQAQSMAPTATPGHAGTAIRDAAALQGEYSFYFSHNYLGDLRSGVTYSRNQQRPYLDLPDGIVRVVSTLPDGSGGVATLQFGGNAGLHTDQRIWTWESTAELQFYPAGVAAHRVKLDADLRLDRFAQGALANPLGTYSYNSLADLAANQPATFTRTLNARSERGGVWNGFVALGDLWRASPALQVLYGLRVEGNVFTDRPDYNPAVDARFGARTDHAPNTLHASPRIGFTFSPPGPHGRPTWTLRGGAGEFRNLLDPNLLAGPAEFTGLPGSVTRLSCLGSAVPAPDWAAFQADPASVPQQCAGATTAFVDTAPPVQLVGTSYTAERSWRTNLSWASSVGRTTFTIGAVYSDNRNQHGTLDLNFAGGTRFTLPDEGRPVFADAASIVPASGAVSPVDARIAADFGRVVSRVADLRSRSRQLVVTLRPAISLGRRVGDPMLAYTLSSSRVLQRGFDGPTFAGPATAEWARGDYDVRHQFVLQTVLRPFGDGRLLLFFAGRVQSGLPFTPLVASDVNGDGLVNDRAFVFDPATVSDTAVARDLRALLTAGAPAVRDCLGRQLARAAARNSCSGPWTAQFNAALRISGQQLLHVSRLDVTLNLANVLSGVDQLLHGSQHLRGWGTAATPDQTLYVVRGFDPAAQRFAYQVNPRFGATLPALTTLRAPFRLTLDANIDLGRPLPLQAVNRWLRPGRGGHPGPRLSVDALRQRLQRQVPDPYTELLGSSDSLLLSPQQVAALRQVDARYQARIDSVWTGLADFLTALPDDFDPGTAYRSMDAVIDDAWELTRQDVQRELRGILTPAQLATLGGSAGQLFHSAGPQHTRMFMP
jgi:carboxypeptidase family protein